METLFLSERDASDSKARQIFVNRFAVLYKACAECVKIWRFGRPQRGTANFQACLQFSASEISLCGCGFPSAPRQHRNFSFQPLGTSVSQNHINADCCRFFGNLWRCYPNAPCVNCVLARKNQLHRAVNSAAGIPAAAQAGIVQLYHKRVLASFQKRRGVNAESVISVRPFPGKLSVYIHFRLRHCAVKEQFGMSVRAGDFELGAVFPFPRPGQSPRVAGGFVHHFLAVNNALASPHIVVLVKLPRYGPVVRQCYGAERRAVFRESPAVTQGYSLVDLRLCHCGESHCAERCRQKTIIFFHNKKIIAVAPLRRGLFGKACHSFLSSRPQAGKRASLSPPSPPGSCHSVSRKR